MPAAKPHTRSQATALLVLLAALLLSLPARSFAAAPDYSLWDELLLTHVRRGYVNYDGFAQDRRLDLFLQQLSSAEPAEIDTTEERKALFINAYNAFAIRGVLDGQSTRTARLRKRFFTGYRFTVLGEATSLERIEHGELRPMGDPRVHFAIVCASLSCPRLASRAFVPERVDRQLEQAARAFVNDVTRNRFDVDHGEACVSRIFDWFAGDFTAGGDSLPQYLAGYIDDPAITGPLAAGQLTLRYDTYDWGLNGRWSGAR